MLHVIFRRSRPLGFVVLILVVLVLLAGLLASRTVGAQPPAAITYVYLRGTDTVGVEVVTVGVDTMHGVQTMRGQPRIEWDQAHRNEVPGLLAMRVYAAGAPADAAPVQQFRFLMRNDSLVVAQAADGSSRTQVLAMKSGTIPIIGTSVLHLSLIAHYARSTSKSTLPVVNVANGQSMEASLATAGDTSIFTVAGLPVRAVWKDGAPQHIAVAPQGLRIVRADRPVGTPSSAPLRIDYGAPADAPYTAEQVTIPTPRGYTLAATLTRPKGVARAPVAITISGSGPQERDSRIPAVPGYQPFRQIADTLGRRGIAVLRYDDRAVGESGGLEGAASVTSADFADDVRAVVAWLRARNDIDGARITLVGHSEGGIIAPMVAATDSQIAGVALLAGTAYRGRDVMMFQNRQSIDRAPNLTKAQRDSIFATVPAQLDALGKSNPWIGYFMSYDPIATIARVRQPVLILHGNTDRQVTPEQADTLAGALRAAGNRAVTLTRFNETNHLFLRDPSGAPDGYSALTDVGVRREVLGALADWMTRTIR
jgi:dipeptidyl aminopeptidase/acylaminoacyl peptidase